jgi:hypothetical protein
MKLSFLTINVPNEYKDLFNELVKILTIMVSVNILMYLSDNNNKLMTMQYIKLIILVLLALSTYWLIVNKLILFDNNNN